ncbi:MAG TPA: hypothetical protein VKP11_03970 [Frankiaceae bacterium]|nr:hypothetical protein [Frankiaceae bacterium]
MVPTRFVTAGVFLALAVAVLAFTATAVSSRAGATGLYVVGGVLAFCALLSLVRRDRDAG